MRSFKSSENIHKKEGGSYYVVSANKASSVTLQSPGNESQRKHCNFANFKQAVDSKTDINQNGVQINKNLSTKTKSTFPIATLSYTVLPYDTPCPTLSLHTVPFTPSSIPSYPLHTFYTPRFPSIYILLHPIILRGSDSWPEDSTKSFW